MQNFLSTQRRPFGPYTLTDYLTNSPNCVLWIKADSGVYSTNPDGSYKNAVDGEAVKKWQSYDYYYNFMYQTVDRYKPIFHTNMVNGLPALSFAKANNNQMYLGTRIENMNILTPSVFLVGRSLASDATQGAYFYGKGKSGSATDEQHSKMCLWIKQDNAHINWWAGSNNDQTQSQANNVPVTLINWNIISVIIRHGASINYNINGVDNIQTYTRRNHYFNTAPFNIGVWGGTWGALTGDIAELIVLNYTAPDFVKCLIIDYLATKYTISVINTVPAALPARSASGTRTARA